MYHRGINSDDDEYGIKKEGYTSLTTRQDEAGDFPSSSTGASDT